MNTPQPPQTAPDDLREVRLNARPTRGITRGQVVTAVWMRSRLAKAAMIISVLERRFEIGLRRALDAVVRHLDAGRVGPPPSIS